MDLNQVRLKTVSQLTDDEKRFLKDNSDKLTDEDKDAYKDVINDDPTPSASNEELEDDSGESVPAEGKGQEPEKTDEQKQTPESKEDTPAYIFKTEEEAREFVKKVQKEDADAKKKAVDAAKTPEEKRYVEENWKPKDWNEAMREAVKIAKKEIKEETEAARKSEEANGKRLQKEWEGIVKENNLPKLDTKKGRELHAAVIKLGLKHGKQNFTDAYEVYSQTPKEFGGGYDPVEVMKKQEEEKNKKETETKKKGASKLTGKNPGDRSSGVSASGIKRPSYEDLKKPRSKLLRESLSG